MRNREGAATPNNISHSNSTNAVLTHKCCADEDASQYDKVCTSADLIKENRNQRCEGVLRWMLGRC